MRTSGDRRAFKRISYICKVECEGPGHQRFATRITDLSTAGAFIDSITCLTPGTVLKLKFRVEGILVDTEAEVRYAMPQVGMGVRFLGLVPEQHGAIQRLVDAAPIEPAFPFNEQPGAAEIPPAGQNVLLGSFSVINIFDVIQMIENSRVTGSLLLTLPAVSGSIDFNDGRIVDAHTAGLSGAPALGMLLEANDGTFEFRKVSRRFNQAITASSNMGLILELLGSRDEETALA